MGNTRKHSNLKLKVIQGNNVVERILQPSEKLTIGRSPDNDIVIYNDHYPKKHTLIECDRNECTLMIDKEMKGEIRHKESSLAFQDLITHKLLPKSGDFYKYQFTHERSGFLSIDDTNISFNFDGAEPLLKNVPSYSWTKANAKSIGKDLVFKLLFIAFFAFEIIWGIFLKGYVLPPETPPDINKMPERFANFIVSQPEVPEPEIVAATEGEGTGEEEEAEEEEQPKPQRKPRRSGGSDGSGDSPKPVTSQGLLGLIGGAGETNQSGSAVDFLVDKGLVQELDDLLGNKKLSKRPGSGGLGTGTGNGVGAGSGDGIDDLLAFGMSGGVDDLIDDIGGVGTVQMQKQGKVNIQQPSKMRGSQAAMGKRTPDRVMAIINAQQGRIMYNYNKYLRTNPNLGGKVAFDLTIEANGSVSSVRVVDDTVGSPEFTRDLSNILRRLKFPPIDEGSVSVNLPFIFNKAN
jgi:periplasmic protein TonB